MDSRNILGKVGDLVLHEVFGWKAPELAWLIFSIVAIGVVSVLTDDTVIGIISALAGITSAILTGKGKPSCYLFGAIYAITYTIIAFRAAYYCSFVLELIYIIPLELIGFYVWVKNMNTETHEIDKRRMKNRTRLLVSLVILSATVFSGLLMQILTNDPRPFLDSFTTVTMAAAMLLTVLRFSEQWIIWIAVNALGTALWLMDFISNGTNGAVLVMWSLYLTNSIVMCIRWYKQTKNTIPQYSAEKYL